MSTFRLKKHQLDAFCDFLKSCGHDVKRRVHDNQVAQVRKDGHWMAIYSRRLSSDVLTVDKRLGDRFEQFHNSAPQSQAERRPRTDAQIVAQTEELAAKLNQWRWGGKLTDGATYRNSQATKARACWEMACLIQELLTDTDPENAVTEVEGTQDEQGGAA